MQGELIDCSHLLHQNIPIWPGDTGLATCITKSVEKDGYATETVNLSTGIGTHIDAPGHFIQGGRLIHQLTLNELRSNGVVIDVSSKCNINPDYELSVGDILKWEQNYGKIPRNSLVCMKTGWEDRFGSHEEFLNIDKSTGIMHFPGFSKESAEFLCSERSINGIAIDTASLDPGNSRNFSVHMTILGNDKYQVENMVLSSLPANGSTILCMPPKVKDAHEMTARVIAFR